MKLNVKFNDRITPVLNKAKNELNNIPEMAYKEFVKNTPIRQGNARRKTKLRNKNQIVADYPYAKKLEEGYSNQSPDGMIKPTEEFVLKTFNKIMTGK